MRHPTARLGAPPCATAASLADLLRELLELGGRDDESPFAIAVAARLRGGPERGAGALMAK
jgi:hypothetical protein